MAIALELRWYWRLVLALAGGLLLYAANPPIGYGWLVIPAVALICLASWSARASIAAVVGLLAGLAYFGPLMYWMTVIGSDAWLGLAAFCAAWFALMALGMAAVSRLPLAPIWLAGVWVLQEALRGRIPWGGFPWGNIAFTAPGQPWDAAVSWLGTPGFAAAAALSAALLARAVVGLVSRDRDPRRQRTSTPAVVAAGVSVAVLVIMSVVPLSTAPATSTQSRVIAYVQGGTPQLGMGAMDVRRAVLDNHVAQTLALAQAVGEGRAEQPVLVVWPENSSDIDPLIDRQAAEAITAASRAVGAPILVGAVVKADGEKTDGGADAGTVEGVWNTGLLWGPEGLPSQMYIKNHPVPFGEFIPFRSQLAGLIGRFDRVPHDFLPGTAAGVMSTSGMTFGDVICFEVAYGDVIDAVVDGGAQVLTVQTNNATYGGTAQPNQQLQITRTRAIEQGRYVVVAATTGVSSVISPEGTLIQPMQQGETGWKVQDVPLRDPLTAATRWGHLVELLACAIGLAGLTWCAVRGLRRRQGRSTPQQPAGDTSLTLEG